MYVETFMHVIVFISNVIMWLSFFQYQSVLWYCHFFSISQYFDTVIFSVSVSTLILSFFQYQSVLWYCHFFSISQYFDTVIFQYQSVLWYCHFFSISQYFDTVIFSVSVSTLILILLFVDIKEEMYKLPTKGSIIIKCICLIKDNVKQFKYFK
jgi:hypothetical protein